MSQDTLILTAAYLPAIQYFSVLIRFNEVKIEAFENYTKQSYRNRCIILSCNGPLDLSIPVIKTNGNHTLMKDIKIDYSTNWQKNHWKAIESAYRTAVYFDFVADFLNNYYSRKIEYLIDFNSQLLNELLSFLELKINIGLTGQFQKCYDSKYLDLRYKIHPKNSYLEENDYFTPKEYFQVFSNKFKFIPNLSIIDLLFNEGLNSISILNGSIKKPVGIDRL